MIAAAFLACSLFLADAPEYRWPLDLPRQLTSSFAEFRAGRFHAGIDLRAPVGQPVYAAANGYISRVRCSPWGYGKAVYLQFKDGNSAIYAHLSDYDDALRQYVRKAQHAAKNYSVDLTPDRALFPVRAGDLIARSGQTGIGAPHLHYELRDPALSPVNPRLLGLTWPDQSKPVIRKLLVAPAGPESRVNGDLLPALLAVQPAGEGRYQAAPVRARGRIGFGVDVLDPAAGGSKLGIHRIIVRHGDTELFRLQHDLLSYANHRNAEVAYHPYLLGQGQLLSLWRWPGNVCASYARSKGDGWWAVPADAVEIEIEVADFNDNAVVLTVPIQPEAETAKKPPVPGPAAQGAAELDCHGNYLALTMRFTAAEPEPPAVTIESGADLVIPPVVRIDAKTFRAGFVPNTSGEYVFQATHPRLKPFARSIHAVRRGDAARNIDLGGVTLHTVPRAPYGWLFARAFTVTEKTPADLKRLSDPVRVWPEQMPLDELVELSFPTPTGLDRPERAHVYRKSGSAWTRQDTTRTAATFKIATRKFGTYAILQDDVPPAIAKISIADGAQTASKRPPLHASVSDTGSGITNVEINCDGAWLLTAYDPEHYRMEWEADEDLPPGPRKITFQATDAAGNTTTRTRDVVIP
jgi:hypothetical protein